MRDECEWKDGEFKQCSRFEPIIYVTSRHEIRCISCGCIIEKPEPEVIIRKSGETWVARYDGVDYLCLQPNRNSGIVSDVWKSVLPTQLKDFHWWKPISEIEITDEIAKLRCLIIGEDCCFNSQLIAVTSNPGLEYKYIAIEPTGSLNRFKTARLATVSDMEESNGKK